MKQGTIAAFQLSIRSAMAAGIALAIAQSLELQYPLYALVGAVIVTDLSATKTRDLSFQRLAGTVVGASLGACFSSFLPLGPATIALGIMTSMILIQLLGLTGAAKVTGYVCGIVMLEHHDNQWSYAMFRLIETVLGIIVATGISFIPKLIPAPTLTRIRTRGQKSAPDS